MREARETRDTGPGTRDPEMKYGGVSDKISHYRELEVWRLAMSLAREVYRMTRSFPASERYGLAAQMQRAAVSIPSNIAEGNARQATRDYARFVGMACGSAAELQTQLMLTRDLGLTKTTTIEEVLALSERVGQMLFRLRESLNRRTGHGSRVPGTGSR